MNSTLRIALGLCSCKEAQPTGLRQAICREMTSRLNALRAESDEYLAKLPSYSDTSTSVEGHIVSFETIADRMPDSRLLVVIRAFARSWSKPNWIAFSGTGYMFADGFVVLEDGTRTDAPDEYMWDFR